MLMRNSPSSLLLLKLIRSCISSCAVTNYKGPVASYIPDFIYMYTVATYRYTANETILEYR